MAKWDVMMRGAGVVVEVDRDGGRIRMTVPYVPWPRGAKWVVPLLREFVEAAALPQDASGCGFLADDLLVERARAHGADVDLTAQEAWGALLGFDKDILLFPTQLGTGGTWIDGWRLACPNVVLASLRERVPGEGWAAQAPSSWRSHESA